MLDQFGRTKHKLRLSLTDRCQFRCLYCMPDNPDWLPKADILRREEIERLTGLFVRELGIRCLRLTGGDPLLRKDVVEIVETLNALRADGLERISMTTNALLLPRHLDDLIAAGLDDINISLDVIDPDRFRELCAGEIKPVLEGIAAARAANIPVKINAVAIRGYNDDAILPLTEWAMAENLPLRFIEFMPLDGRRFWEPGKVIKEQEILDTLATRHSVTPIQRGSDPATEYQLGDDYRIGIISTVSNPFCTSCDRVRLTATGGLYACLFSQDGRDLREPLREGASDTALLELIRHTIWNKHEGFVKAQGYVEREITMHALGG